ncbi:MULTISPECIES: septum formation initiator family protein [unclassified Fusibacter]|uniref:FtsB family cell division protein n=1 Tax=unclassified Fusibacter TaxID=2624464 RepID=UPI0013E90DE5|nr:MULTISPECIES: septum formation initiator family protein [unclassified Fusibacter]MCK8059527.1 septum formation initiator family protein [Fusibacter sp. A2]NPE21009.1 septum formation initiator family protein [Fusibacter sp. A1]
MAKKKLRIIRRNRFVFLGVLIIAVLCLLVWTNQEIKLKEMAYDQKHYEEVKATLSAEVEELRVQVDALGSDEAIEEYARERLQMIKKDEIQYIIKEKPE